VQIIFALFLSKQLTNISFLLILRQKDTVGNYATHKKLTATELKPISAEGIKPWFSPSVAYLTARVRRNAGKLQFALRPFKSAAPLLLLRTGRF
jgi:hypothetical protein